MADKVNVQRAKEAEMSNAKWATIPHLGLARALSRGKDRSLREAKTQRVPLITALLLAIMLASMFPVGEAQAAAYAKWVDAPKLTNGRVVGVAEINTNCEGTFGCHSYIKIEYQPAASPTGLVWHNPWQYFSGRWANQGRNEVSATPALGCGYYRTVVDTYNDMPGQASVSTSFGSVELSLSGGVKRYHKSTRSPSKYICRYA